MPSRATSFPLRHSVCIATKSDAAKRVWEMLSVQLFLMGLQRPAGLWSYTYTHTHTHTNTHPRTRTHPRKATHPIMAQGVSACGEDGEGVTERRGFLLFQTRAEVLGGERESQGYAKFRAPRQKYSKYSYVYLDAHVYSLLIHLFPRITSLGNPFNVTGSQRLSF